ncbi:KilA-N domain-containing protein [Pseudoxanthomonas winnipegensis]|uniref:KilA-N domain-containing protein n=1 Tax=Pseudoxanthomonas winnipegensis TaxID=2480810 RepID=UPI00197F225D|nr:KilA-N domain-containing protein [Pseudoxanthomonas winnipegensis]
MSALVIANTQIRQDGVGRYCLNDLHQASGGALKHQPFRFTRTQQAQDLVAEIEKDGEGLTISGEAPLIQVNDGFGNGTYAVKELVYAYAMWISAAFHLHVIRAYDALVREAPLAAPVLAAQPQHRADQLVSAGRIFSAALRTARQLRMPPARAMQAAFACAHRHTGIDWADELDATLPEPALPAADPLQDAITEYLAGVDSFEMAHLIEALHLGDPRDSGLMKRIGAIARRHGWAPRRHVRPGGAFYTVWRPLTGGFDSQHKC